MRITAIRAPRWLRHLLDPWGLLCDIGAGFSVGAWIGGKRSSNSG